MDMRRLYLVVLVLVMVCQQTGMAQNKPPAQGNGAPAKEELDAQLKINRDAVLGGDIGAAVLMLSDANPKAREILLDALKQSKNSPARMAVCQALIRADKNAVKDIAVFIGPLLRVFDTQVPGEAQLAADATRIFEYEQIGESLEKFVTDSATPTRARVNAIQALKPRLDKKATIKLIELMDDSDRQVSSEAGIALASLGIEPGATKEQRQATIERIRAQTPEIFLRNRALRSEQQIRDIRTDRDSWIRIYITLLTSAYKTLPDDTAKGKFLAEHLASSRAPVKLWALEEAFRWYKGTTPNFPSEQLQPILIASISDPNRDVRLKIAEVLAQMVMSSSAQPLLTQLKAEQDDQVKTKQFEALGRACSSTAASGTEDPLPPEIKAIRTQALEWAEKFLFDENDTEERIRVGAQVTARLLRRDGLEDAEEKKYLDLLLKRYAQLKGNPGGALAAELLGAMAGLCAQSSACKDQAVALYRPLFVEALGDGSDSVRETAVIGLGNINKAEALAILRERGLFNDKSRSVRLEIIDMAGEVRAKTDLRWLAEKIGVNSESEPARKAMMGIFNSSGTDVLKDWVGPLAAEASKLTDEHKILFLELAESKAEGEEKAEMLKTVRIRLAEIHSKMSQFDKAAECWKKVQAAATTPQEKDAAAVKRLDAYLSGAKLEPAAQLLTETLAKQDLDRESPLLKSVEEHLAKPRNGLDPKDVMDELAAIQAPKPRTKWVQWLKEWQLKLSKEDKPAAKPKPPTG